MRSDATFLLLVGCLAAATTLRAQAYGKPDRGAPGDEGIQAWLAREAQRISETFLEGVTTREEFLAQRAEYVEQYRDMLGISRLFRSDARNSPLQVTVTKTHAPLDGVVVDNLHFQSLPGLYVTGNLYRPASPASGGRLPTVLYVCGHAGRGRHGNKVAYQSHGIWFARHGYNCLMLDTLQLGEVAGLHHGTYRERRWWWLSLGYTPAGIECWNGIRAIDYLVGRDDVDSKRLAVTGISGGGAATFWIAAADERIAIAAPVSGMADLPSYLGNRVINGHCDCMFLHNTYRWPWTRIAALIAPRPLLFVNSDADPIFPMDANERVIARLERLYSLFGASDRVDAVVSVGGHAYREDLRKAVYRFVNTHLKGDPREVLDSEVDLVERRGQESIYPIDPHALRVFPVDEDLPGDALNGKLDESWAVISSLAEQRALPEAGEFFDWRQRVLGELRRRTFGSIDPGKIKVSRTLEKAAGSWTLEVDSGVRVSLERRDSAGGKPARALLVIVAHASEERELQRWARRAGKTDSSLWVLRPRGVGPSAWTRRNPPNFVERSHVLLGQTVESARVGETIAVARFLVSEGLADSVELAGAGGGAVIATYAAALDASIPGVALAKVPLSHLDASVPAVAPAFLNVLQICDIPQAIGLIAPRPIELTPMRVSSDDVIRKLYQAAGAESSLRWVAEEDGSR